MIGSGDGDGVDSVHQRVGLLLRVLKAPPAPLTHWGGWRAFPGVGGLEGDGEGNDLMAAKARAQK